MIRVIMIIVGACLFLGNTGSLDAQSLAGQPLAYAEWAHWLMAFIGGLMVLGCVMTLGPAENCPNHPNNCNHPQSSERLEH